MSSQPSYLVLCEVKKSQLTLNTTSKHCGRDYFRTEWDRKGYKKHLEYKTGLHAVPQFRPLFIWLEYWTYDSPQLHLGVQKWCGEEHVLHKYTLTVMYEREHVLLWCMWARQAKLNTQRSRENVWHKQIWKLEWIWGPQCCPVGLNSCSWREEHLSSSKGETELPATLPLPNMQSLHDVTAGKERGHQVQAYDTEIMMFSKAMISTFIGGRGV